MGGWVDGWLGWFLGGLWVVLALASRRRRMPRALYVFKCEAGSATPPQYAPKSTLTLIICTSIFILYQLSAFSLAIFVLHGNCVFAFFLWHCI